MQDAFKSCPSIVPMILFWYQQLSTTREPRMDFQEAIISILGIQDVDVVDLKLFKKDLRMEIKVQQRRSECYCVHCGMQFDHVKEWQLRSLKAPAMGVYRNVTIKFMQMRGFCEPCDRSSVARVEWIHPKFESMTC